MNLNNKIMEQYLIKTFNPNIIINKTIGLNNMEKGFKTNNIMKTKDNKYYLIFESWNYTNTFNNLIELKIKEINKKEFNKLNNKYESLNPFRIRTKGKYGKI